MPVLFLIAIVVVLVGIFFAATGRGGEMSYEPADHAPLDLGPVSAADIALLRPPTAMWGYNMQVTDEALDQIARAMRERDVTIAYLQDRLAGHEHGGSYTTRPDAYSRQDLEASGFPEGPGAPEYPGVLEPPSAMESPEDPQAPEDRQAPEDPQAWEASKAWEDPDAPENPENPEASWFPEDPDASQSPHDLEAAQSPAEPEPLEIPGMHEPLETPEPLIVAPPAAAAAALPEPQRTAMVLKASGPRQPEPHEVTQPSQALQDPGEADDATEPSAALRHDDGESGEPTQPSATLAPNETPGPQGAYDTHGWWAEQKEAAREEQARRQASGEKGDDSMAAAEEQGW